MNPEILRIMKMAVNDYSTRAPYNEDKIFVTYQTEYDLANFDLVTFSKILIQEYELQKREERRNVKSELGYSRVGLNNI
jgi:hypothetical protein